MNNVQDAQPLTHDLDGVISAWCELTRGNVLYRGVKHEDTYTHTDIHTYTSAIVLDVRV